MNSNGACQGTALGRANGQLAFRVYERDDTDQVYRAHSIQVLTFERDFVSKII